MVLLYRVAKPDNRGQEAVPPAVSGPVHLSQMMMDNRFTRPSTHHGSGPPPSPNAFNDFFHPVTTCQHDAVQRCLEREDPTPYMQATDQTLKMCLHLAAKAGSADLVHLFITLGAAIEAREPIGRTPLHLACEYGHKKAVGCLLHAGANLEARDGLGRTPFHLGCCSENRNVVSILLHSKPSLIHATDKHERTGLYYAVLSRHWSGQDITKLLLAKGADVNARDLYGRTPLHYACEDGQSNVVPLLLRNGADPHIQDTVGRKSPLQMAATPLIRDQIKSHLGQKGELPVAESRAIEGAVDQATSPMQRGTMPQQPYSPPAEDKREREQQLAVEPSRPGPKEGLSALSVSTGPLRERFMRLMLHVQQGGLDDLQHIKQPHPFTASWMEAIHTHQQLFQSISKVSSVETALRVFNLLHPPTHIPPSKGDEHEIAASTRNERSVFLPVTARERQMVEEIDRLLKDRDAHKKTIHDLHHTIQDMKSKVEGSFDAREVAAVKDDTERMRQELTKKELALKDIEQQLRAADRSQRFTQEELQRHMMEGGDLRTKMAMMAKRAEGYAKQEAHLKFLRQQLESVQEVLKQVQQEKVAAEGAAIAARRDLATALQDLEYFKKHAG
ncbi:unnamed protein product [Vitrella brassicaformis CCMP3155]|uniref:Uncharacterized protein n=1 Tax=Vitrella brassicaformis (strain CCMP3155) TaxID=1169540 RepID=A0A0G4F6C4_VITBC|nr:unnamed protein product [Vitrella brassicaformis CCMP3155]|eukprot:CEM07957.1 unnamed protein product [Vitrella brassicaformis CCMP3155]